MGRQKQTDYIERHWDAKVEYNPAAATTLTAAHQQGRIDDAWRTHGTIYGTTWAGLDMGNDLRRALDQQRDLTYLQIRHNPHGPLIETVHAGLYRQAQSESEDRLRTGNRWNVQGFDVESFGALLTLTSLTPVGRLTYGLDAQRDRVDTFSRNLNSDGSVRSVALQGPVADDSTYDLAGLFVQSETPLHHRLDLLLGGRYAYARADAPRVENPNGDEPLAVSGNWNAVVGTARLTYALDAPRSTFLYAGVAQGFRAPNLSNLTRFDIARTDEIETPVEDLDPEYYLTGEVGLKAVTGPLSGQLAYSYTRIDGMIIRTPTGRVIDEANEVTKRNAGDGTIQSLEMDIRYRIWQGLSVFGAFTWMEGKVDTYLTADGPRTRDYVSRLMPPTGRVGLRWQEGDRYWIETVCTAAAKASRLAAGDMNDTSRIPPGGTPNYTVLDIRAGWRATSDLAFSVALENVTDKDYRIHGSGLNEPGRNLVLAADWVF